MSRDLGPPERVRGGSSKIGRDPSEYGSVPALLPRRCAIRQAVIPPHNSTPSAPETVRISTGCRKIQALPSHGEGDPTKSGEIRAKTGRYPPPSHVGAPSQAVIPPHNPTPSTPKTAWISTRLREIQALLSDNEGDPAKSGEIRAKTGRYPPISHVLGARRPSYRRTTRPTRPPKPLGSRPDVARSRPSRATARRILQNKARSERRRVETRPSPTCSVVIPPHNPTPRPPKPLGS